MVGLEVSVALLLAELLAADFLFLLFVGVEEAEEAVPPITSMALTTLPPLEPPQAAKEPIGVKLALS